MDRLQSIFPGHPTPSLKRALNEADGDLDRAIDIFLREQEEQEFEEQARRQHHERPRQGKQLKKKPVASEEDVILNVLHVFPDACLTYIVNLYREYYVLHGSDITEFIVNELAETDYPKSEPVPQAGMKSEGAKEDETGENGPDYEIDDRPPVVGERCELVRSILKQEFPLMPVRFIEKAMAQNRNYLDKSYSALVKAGKSYNPRTNTPYKQLLRPRKMEGRSDELKKGKDWTEISAELEYARSKGRREETQAQMDADARLEAQINEKEPQESNTVMECGCCFDEYPFISMTHCNDLHFFCLDCARRNAETEVGRGRHKLSCMDGSGCKALFPRGQMLRFLDAKILSALAKIEQEDALRIADIDGLVKCPFCHYGAIYPPPEVDKEFNCQNPDCMEISCRLCNQKSHFPLTCQEYAKDNKLNARHRVEEAMTEALVRKCNKCSYPYIKEDGCNQIYCSRCQTFQCYICSETIGSYGHFKGQVIGGERGNCPLYDNTEERHHIEVETAAKKTTEILHAELPELNNEDLKIKLSKRVRKAEEAKRSRSAAAYGDIPPYQPQEAPQPAAAPPGVGRPAARPPPPAAPGANGGTPRYRPLVAQQPVAAPPGIGRPADGPPPPAAPGANGGTPQYRPLVAQQPVAAPPGIGRPAVGPPPPAAPGANGGTPPYRPLAARQPVAAPPDECVVS
ncbi:hypothetical protein C7212DRAFT_276751 [Tuber magnatum]|uniref:RING-type domain-containing protein n=1 Tax=Tuber magnatum TaxID=42249 RepID=A0A317SVZ9_9PEZI|nr:hypothetical protein C7212DRAFT_276751 [Tuber magnatum]